MSLPDFRIYRVDNGFARITWRAKNQCNEWVYYCIQPSDGWGKYAVMRCGQPPECEPSHRVPFSGMPLAELLELPRNDGTDLEREIRDWILTQ